MADKPHLRRLVRGSIFCELLRVCASRGGGFTSRVFCVAATALVGGVSVAAVVLPVVAVTVTVGLPVYGVYKGVKKLRHRMRRPARPAYPIPRELIEQLGLQ